MWHYNILQVSLFLVHQSSPGPRCWLYSTWQRTNYGWTARFSSQGVGQTGNAWQSPFPSGSPEGLYRTWMTHGNHTLCSGLLRGRDSRNLKSFFSYKLKESGENCRRHAEKRKTSRSSDVSGTDLLRWGIITRSAFHCLAVPPSYQSNGHRA